MSEPPVKNQDFSAKINSNFKNIEQYVDHNDAIDIQSQDKMFNDAKSKRDLEDLKNIQHDNFARPSTPPHKLKPQSISLQNNPQNIKRAGDQAALNRSFSQSSQQNKRVS